MEGETREKFIKSYNEYSDAIFRHIYFRLNDRELAKDLLQETFYKTWLQISKGNDIENLRAFLYRVAENLVIDYSAIFCQSDHEYERLTSEAGDLGKVVDDTPTGPLYKLQKPLETPAGPLWLVKIRKPDETRPQRGDSDFKLKDYGTFKESYLQDTEHFKLIERGSFEMIELRDSDFDVLVYFSNPPLTEQFDIK